MASLKITEPLTPLQWEAVLEYLYECGAEGIPLGVSIVRLRDVWGVLPVDIERVPSMFRKYALERWRDGMESPAALTDEMAELLPQGGGGRLPQGIMGILCEAVGEMFGVSMTKAKVTWQRGPEITMSEGDTYLEKEGEGRDWLVRAVIVRRANGTEEVFPEHRVRGMRRKLRAGCKKPQLLLDCLTLSSDGINEKAMLRRLAAWKFTYFGRESGVMNGVELADVFGVKKQTMHKQLKRVRQWHETRTGEASGRLGGCVTSRGNRTKPVWRKDPAKHLRERPNGTLFLLRMKNGIIHTCELCGNMPGDSSWKAQRFTDFKIISLDRMSGSEFMDLDINDMEVVKKIA